MQIKNPAPVAAFARALRSFQTGGVTYSDFLLQVKEHLAAGAEPDELLEIVKRREAVDPLPAHVRDAVTVLVTGRRPADGPPADGLPADGVSPETTDASGLGADVPLPDPEDTVKLVTASVGDRLLDRFQLIELIGEGALSRIYKATDLQADPAAASATLTVKVLTRPIEEHTETFALWRKEVLQQRLTHPNVVQVRDCAHDGSTAFLTQEYFPGQSLLTQLHTGALEGQAYAIIDAIAAALEYAHNHYVVHGDLKPGNVIIGDGGVVKVTDFGIATGVVRPKTPLERRAAALNKTEAGTPVAPRYSSPQLMSRHTPEVSDDVYSLACMTYELLTGVHPFDDGTGSQALRYPPPPRSGLSSRQYEAVLHALQFERRTRTPTVQQFMADFSGSGPRSPWRARGMWAAAVLVVVVLGWLVAHQVKKPDVALAPVGSAKPAPLAASAAATPATLAKTGSVIRDCAACPAMTILPTGRFKQGSASAEKGALASERPQHWVVINTPLAISTNAVTVGDFQSFVSATQRDMRGCDVYDGTWRHDVQSSFQDPGFEQSALHPVTCVSWNDAVAYARWLSIEAGHTYRLPSASEWEYAARGGSEAARPWTTVAGACAAANVADQSAARRYPGWEAFACDDGYVNTAPVGSFVANAFALNDMLGNVFQWTEDCWNESYAKATLDGSARTDGNCRERELRGGSWFSPPAYVRAAYRNHFPADYRTSTVGFRVVREYTP